MGSSPGTWYHSLQVGKSLPGVLSFSWPQARSEDQGIDASESICQRKPDGNLRINTPTLSLLRWDNTKEYSILSLSPERTWALAAAMVVCWVMHFYCYFSLSGSPPVPLLLLLLVASCMSYFWSHPCFKSIGANQSQTHLMSIPSDWTPFTGSMGCGPLESKAHI
jgi:hypothetical protein